MNELYGALAHERGIEGLIVDAHPANVRISGENLTLRQVEAGRQWGRQAI